MRKYFKTKDGLDFQVREAVPEDAASLLAGHRTVVAERLDYVITQPEDPARTLVQEQLWIEECAQNQNSILLVAVRGVEIIGWAVLRGGTRYRTRHTAELGIAVVHDWRGRGVGRALTEMLLDWVAEHPIIEKIKLQVVASNERALALYRKLGFLEEGRAPQEYKKADGTYLDSVLMYRFVGQEEDATDRQEE